MLPPKRRYPATALHGVTTQQISRLESSPPWKPKSSQQFFCFA